MGFYYYLMRLLLVFVGFFSLPPFFFSPFQTHPPPKSFFLSDSQKTNDPQHRPLLLGTREMKAVLLWGLTGRGGLQVL